MFLGASGGNIDMTIGCAAVPDASGFVVIGGGVQLDQEHGSHASSVMPYTIASKISSLGLHISTIAASDNLLFRGQPNRRLTRRRNATARSG